MRLLLTLFGPVTWVGFLVAIFWHWRRLRHERKVFLTAIDQHATGLWAGLFGGVGVAMLVSVLSVLLGLLLPANVLAALTGLTLAALVLSALGFGPWWLGLVGLLPSVASALGLSVVGPATWGWRLAALVACLWLAEAVLLKLIDPPIDVPTIRMGKRGADIAVYAHRQFYWVPLVLPIDGHALAALPWWPTLTVGATHFALLGLPLVLGVALRTQKQLPHTALVVWAKQYALAGAAAALVAVGAWLMPASAQVWLFGLAGVAAAAAVANHWAAARGHHYVSRTHSGVRLVAIQPETPAATMGLEAGDVVLLCNHRAVHNDAELYAAIQTLPTYCRLKVMRLDGAIKLCETAIYEGAPHELGMITFAEEQA